MSKKEKGFMDRDHSVVIGGDVKGLKGLNGNGKNSNNTYVHTYVHTGKTRTLPPG